MAKPKKDAPKPTHGKVWIALTVEEREALRMIAERNSRTMTQQVRYWIKEEPKP